MMSVLAGMALWMSWGLLCGVVWGILANRITQRRHDLHTLQRGLQHTRQMTDLAKMLTRFGDGLKQLQEFEAKMRTRAEMIELIQTELNRLDALEARIERLDPGGAPE